MIYPLSELVDRYSILCLKKERTKNSKKIDAECERFRLAILAGVGTWVWYPTVIRKMKVINGKIWDLESDIRKGKEKELGLEEVGRRAIKIRQLNKQRIAAKNKIAKMMGEFEEIKVDHGSAD